MNTSERLRMQLDFLREIGKLVSIVRRTLVVDGSRRENDAEHSWHMATACVLLREHCPFAELDLSRAIQLCLVHDLVEIEAGDTYAYDAAANVGREAREQAAADVLFGRLPTDQRAYFRGLWDDFEARRSPESKLANALDRVQSVLVNHAAGGGSWKEHGVRASQVAARIEPVREATPALHEALEALIRDAVDRGWLAPG